MDEREPCPDLDQLVVALARRLRAAVRVLDVRRGASGLESLTLRLERVDGSSLDIDVAHVSTFEASTWEPAPRDLQGLVGAPGHTMHARGGRVEFRVATWVEAFEAEPVARAIERRLAAERAPARP